LEAAGVVSVEATFLVGSFPAVAFAVASLVVVVLEAVCLFVFDSGAAAEAVFAADVADVLAAGVAAGEVVEVVSAEATFLAPSLVVDVLAVASLVVDGFGVDCFAVRDSGAGVDAEAVAFGAGVADAFAVWLVAGFVSAAFSGWDVFLVVSAFAVAAFAAPSVAAGALEVASFAAAVREAGAGVVVLVATDFSAAGALFAVAGSAAPASRGRSSGARAFSHLRRLARSSSLSADDGAPADCACTMRPANNAAKIRENRNTNLTEGADFIRGECGPYTSVFAGHKCFPLKIAHLERQFSPEFASLALVPHLAHGPPHAVG
jgi:hypothetical protein